MFNADYNKQILIYPQDQKGAIDENNRHNTGQWLAK
jgi:hypothetical protein